jgi:hypothetical protein
LHELLRRQKSPDAIDFLPLWIQQDDGGKSDDPILLSGTCIFLGVDLGKNEILGKFDDFGIGERRLFQSRAPSSGGAREFDDDGFVRRPGFVQACIEVGSPADMGPFSGTAQDQANDDEGDEKGFFHGGYPFERRI